MYIMMISSMTGTNNNMQAGRSGMNMQADSVTKNIQNQIAKAQKQLQELSSNEKMTLEEKMKKRQEIQQEITKLNQQLRQHQIQQRKEQQSKGTSMDDMHGGKQNAGMEKPGSKGSGLSQEGMQAMILADSSMKQAQVQGSVAARMEGRASVLKAEIKQDAGRNTEAKEAELAEAEQKAMNASAAQMNTFAGINQTVKEAANAEQDNKEDEADTKNGNKNSEMDKADNNEQETSSAANKMAATYTCGRTYSNKLSSLVSVKINEKV